MQAVSGCEGAVLTFCSVILGRAIKNEYLAIGTLLGTAGLALSFTGGSKKETPAPGAGKPTLEQVKETVKINASSRCVPQFCFDCRVYSTSLLVHSEEEQLYVSLLCQLKQNGSSTTDQVQQYQELHRGGGEGVKTLVDVGSCLHDCIEFIPPSLQFHCYASLKTVCYIQV